MTTTPAPKTAPRRHHTLLHAFVSPALLRRIDNALESTHYRTHEFGDTVLIERTRQSTAGRRVGNRARGVTDKAGFWGC